MIYIFYRYIVGSLIYYYVEKYMIKQIFYAGFNENFVSKLRHGKKEKLKLLRISSDIQDYSSHYEIWIDFITASGHKIQSEKRKIDCTKICDERGYVVKEVVYQVFRDILTEELVKII